MKPYNKTKRNCKKILIAYKSLNNFEKFYSTCSLYTYCNFSSHYRDPEHTNTHFLAYENHLLIHIKYNVNMKF